MTVDHDLPLEVMVELPVIVKVAEREPAESADLDKLPEQ
jgi:hypothetical protein